MIPRIPRIVPAFALKLLPTGFLQGDNYLTLSARAFLGRAAVGTLALILGLAGIWLVADTTWRDVIAGALLAWSVSAIVWAVGSYRRRRDEVRVDLRRVAEVDLLHARLNHLAHKWDLPTVAIDERIEHILRARESRIAHMNNLEEFGPLDTSDGMDFWDQEAMSRPEE